MAKTRFFAAAILAAGSGGGGSVAAEDGVWLSGFMSLGAGFETGREGVGVVRDAEIHVNLRRTLTDAYAISGRIELEGWTSNDSPDQIDEAYAILETPFGDFKVGGDDSAKARYVRGVIYSKSGFHGYFDNGTYVGIDAKGGLTGGGDPVGVYYDSPDVGGFRFGFSYHPDRTSDGLADADAGRIGDSGSPVFRGQDQIAAGFVYERGFGATTVGIGVAGLTRRGARDVWHVGADAKWNGFTLAAVYEEDGPSDAALGVRYETGPWTFAGGYGFTGVEGGDQQNHSTAGWVTYDFAPGVAGSVGVEHHVDELSRTDFGGSAILSLNF